MTTLLISCFSILSYKISHVKFRKVYFMALNKKRAEASAFTRICSGPMIRCRPHPIIAPHRVGDTRPRLS